MSTGNMNNLVAKELSDALARCKQNGVDEQSLRTGLLTITIANFVNRIGMENTIALFSELPSQISSGIFDRYIDPETNTLRRPQPQMQAAASMAGAPVQPQPQQQSIPQGNYQNSALPQNFVQPNALPQENYGGQPSQQPQTPMAYTHQTQHQPDTSAEKRRLAD